MDGTVVQSLPSRQSGQYWDAAATNWEEEIFSSFHNDRKGVILSALKAAADPNAIPMEEMKRIHDQNEQMKHRIVTQTWTNLSNTLPDLEQKNTPPRSVQIPNLEPVRTNKVFQTYKDIAHDLTHFKDLPQKTNLQK